MRISEKYKGSIIEDVFITESDIDSHYELIGDIRADSNRMNSNIAELKLQLSKIAKKKGANAIMHYRYGQKRKLLRVWDDTKWYSSGVAIKLSDIEI